MRCSRSAALVRMGWGVKLRVDGACAYHADRVRQSPSDYPDLMRDLLFQSDID